MLVSFLSSSQTSQKIASASALDSSFGALICSSSGVTGRHAGASSEPAATALTHPWMQTSSKRVTSDLGISGKANNVLRDRRRSLVLFKRYRMRFRLLKSVEKSL